MKGDSFGIDNEPCSTVSARKRQSAATNSSSTFRPIALSRPAAGAEIGQRTQGAHPAPGLWPVVQMLERQLRLLFGAGARPRDVLDNTDVAIAGIGYGP